MARTNSAAVIALLGDNYGAHRSGALPNIQQFIDSATLIVDRVAACAIKKNYPLTVAELEHIERWLSAHAYAQMDMLLQSKGTKGASGSFQGTTAMGLDSTRYGQHAKTIDTSGCLTALDKRQNVGIGWLGKQPADQIEHVPGRGR